MVRVTQEMQSLLHKSLGYPTLEGWNPFSVRLRPIPQSVECIDTAMGGVYWIKCCKSDLSVPLTCVPQRNAIAPGASTSFNVWYEHPTKPGWIGIPRFLGLSLFGKPVKDIRTEGLMASFSLSQKRQLREYQKDAVEKCLHVLQEWGGATLIADCGAGKTAMAFAIASALKRKTIVLLNREFLMHQWKEDITGTAERDSWVHGAKPGWLQGKVYKDGDIVLASIDSLSQCTYDANILNAFGLVIIDEMHHLAATTLSQVLPRLPARYILGISATPNRNDGLEHLLYWLAGPTAFVYKRIPSITGQRETVHVKRVDFKEGNQCVEYTKGGTLNFSKMITSLSKDHTRNLCVLGHINALKERGKILVVTSLVEHAKYLAQALGCTAMYGGSKTSSEGRIIVATYQLLEEGYDDADLDTLVLALPRSKIQQVVGRCERTKEGKLTPLVIDIVDTFSVFFAMFKKRLGFYSERGFLITS